MPASIFVSYRRASASGSAGRLYDALVTHFGKDAVFMDVASIEPGDDFIDVLVARLAQCQIALVVIDREWLSARNHSGQPRLANPDDFVRSEIEISLRNRILVIPVLVDGASMPTPDQLPVAIQELASRQAVEITPSRFQYDVGRLLSAIASRVDSNYSLQSGDTPGRYEYLNPDSGLAIPSDFAAAFDKSVTVRAPIRQTWEILADIRLLLDLKPMASTFTPLTQGYVRRGYRFRFKMAGGLRYVGEAVEAQPPSCLCLLYIRHSGQIDSADRWTLIAQGSGSTGLYYQNLAPRGNAVGSWLDRQTVLRPWLSRVVESAESGQRERRVISQL